MSTGDVLVLIAVTTHRHLSLSAYLGNLTGNYCRFSNQIKHLWPRIVPLRISVYELAYGAIHPLLLPSEIATRLSQKSQ